MADKLEPLHEKASADTKSCSIALMDQVNKEHAGAPIKDSASGLYSKSEAKVKELFGSLQLFSHDSTTPPSRNEISGTAQSAKESPTTTALTAVKELPATKDGAKAASNIEDAFHWYKKDDYDKVDNALKGKTPEQIKSLDEAFKQQHDGKGLEETLNQRWKNQPEELAKTRALLHPIESATAARPAHAEETAENIKAQDAKALDVLKNDPEVQIKHNELAGRARETMKEPKLSKFMNDMSNFETREASMQRQYQKENEAKGMSPEESAKQAEKTTLEQVKDSYKHIETLLEKNDKAPVSEKDRIQLAQQVINHVSEPASVSQGCYGTCNVATVESRTYSRDPAEATRLVSEVANSGQYKREGKPTITLDKESLKKQGDALQESSEKANQRDFASQIFEVTAVNVFLEHKNSLTNPPGQLRYEQHTPVKGQSMPPDDNGERLMDYSTHPAKVVQRGIDMNPADVALASKEISPKGSEGGVVIELSYQNQVANLQKKVIDIDFAANGINDGKALDLGDPQWATKAHDDVSQKNGLDEKVKEHINSEISALEKQQNENKESSVMHVQNEQELRDTLTKMKDEGKLPVIIAVDTNNEPFWSDSRGGDAGGAGGAHVVTITDYDEKTGVAKMVNQWGAQDDHDIPVKRLFEATRGANSELGDLKQETENAAAAGHRDYVKEYELLRLEKQQGAISDADYDKLAVQQTIDRFKDFKSGKIAENDPDYLAANREFSLMRNTLRSSKNLVDQQRCAAIEAKVSAGIKA